MTKPTRVLILEDAQTDAELILRGLEVVGSEIVADVVSTQKQFVEALTSYTPDIVISDFYLPGFDGLQAIEAVGRHAPGTPVIIATGSINEETAVACLRAGAADYVLKDNLTRLPHAMRDAIDRARTLRAKEEAERALAATSIRLRNILNNARDIVFRLVRRERWYCEYVNPSVGMLTVHSADEYVQDPDVFVRLIPPGDLARLERIGDGLELPKDPMLMQWATGKGEMIWVELRVVLTRDESGVVTIIDGIARDVTDRISAAVQLAESEQLYHSLFRDSHAAMLLVDPVSGEITDANHAALSFYGWALDELRVLGLPGISALPTDNRAFRPDQVRQGLLHRYNSVHRTASGELRDVDVHIGTVTRDGRELFSLIVNDVTSQHLAQERISNLNQVLLAIAAVNGVLVRDTDRHGLAAAVVNILVETRGYRGARILLTDAAGNIEVNAAAGKLLPRCARIAATTVERTCCPRLDGREQGPTCRCDPGCGQPDLLCVAIQQAEQIYGYLLVGDAIAMNDEEVKLIVQLAGDIALSLRGLAAQAKLRRAVETTIDVLGVVGESRDPYTAGHQRRVARLAVAIGEEMGLPSLQLDTIRFAAAIHDIGKLSVPGEILSKPTALAPLEMALVRQHPEIGATILRSVETPWPLAEVILQHHERLDGSGYPHGLTGDQICIEARVMAVADVVEAMANHRPYRPALGLDQALQEIESNAGVLYDAASVVACCRVIREQGFRLES